MIGRTPVVAETCVSHVCAHVVSDAASSPFDTSKSSTGRRSPDAIVALREMLRVVKPGGALCFVVWGRSELNPFTSIVTKVMSGYIPMPPAEPDAPGAFRFAEPGKLASPEHSLPKDSSLPD